MRSSSKVKLSFIVLLSLLFVVNAKAQIIFTFSSPTVDSVNKAYTLTGVGAYYKNTGLSSISTGTIDCNGSTISATGGGGGFVFRTDVSGVIGIIIYGQGTGSNRTLTSVTTSTSLAGTYTSLSTATSTSKMVTSGACDSLLIFTGTPINAGTFMDFTFSGNINVTSIVLLTSGSLSAPIVITASPSSVTFNSAVSGGNVTGDGNVTIISRGVLYGTSANPQIGDGVSTQITDPGTGTGTFTASLTGLTPSTLYHVQAYATNAIGTSYGGDSTFTTPAATPTLTTNPAGLGFGTISVDSSSLQAFTISGSYLTSNGTITINAPTGFQVSLNSAGPFTSTLQVPYSGQTIIDTTIFVQFIPTTSANYADNIIVIGGGIASQTVGVTGTGTTASLSTSKGLSNVGRDFWTGFGASEKMFSGLNGDNSPSVNGGETGAGGTSGTGSSSSDPDVLFTFNNPTGVIANVTISIPGFPGFTPIVYQVPANSQVTTNPFIIPQSWNGAAAVDARLDSEGVSNKGIHITSDTDIVVFQHAFTKQVYAASLLFPTPTLGKQYTSLNYTQVANSNVGRSYCFAVATDTGTTVIQVTLPSTVATQTHAAGSTFTDTLQQGEVLNLFGAFIGADPAKSGYYDAVDLTGVTFNAFGANGTSCKKLAFFSGSSKIGIACNLATNSPTGENLFQQVFPSQVWGFKYVVVPTANLYVNKFRVLINNPATNVTVDGAPITLLTTLDPTGTFYEITNTDTITHIINSDKPIMVAEYIVNPQQCGNPDNNGDANMVYLSSIQQGIDTVSVVSGGLSGSVANTHFINVAMRTNITNTFKLDGVPSGSSFRPVTYDPTYSFAQFSVAAGTHTLASADSGFIATAYGLGSAESYSYNAGTSLKDLIHLSSTQNTLGTGSAGTTSLPCRNAPFVLTVTLPYTNPAYIIWNFSNNPLITPSKADTLNNPVPIDSSVNADGTKLYKFIDTVSHTYSVIGQFNFNVIAQDPTADGCSSQIIAFTQQVDRGPLANFTFSIPTGCSGTVQFTDSSQGNGGTLNRWVWNYGDGTPVSSDSTNPTPSHLYVSGGNYTVKLRVLTAQGCYADTSKVLPFSSALVAGFTVDHDSVCLGSAITFTDTSSIQNGTITQRAWNFDDGTPATVVATNAPIPHTYTAAGIYTDTLTVLSSGGCSVIATKQVTVSSITQPTFSPLTPVCSNADNIDLTTFVNPPGGTFSGSGVSGNTFNPANASTGINTITYTYTSAGGCSDSAKQTITVNPSVPLSITPVNPQCITADPITLSATPAGGTFSGDGVSGSSFNPATAGVGTHQITYTDGGCSSPVTVQIVVGDTATLNIAVSPAKNVDPGTTITLTGTSNIPGTYLWSSNVSAALKTPTDSVTTSQPTTQTFYTFQVTTEACTATDTVTVFIDLPCLHPRKAFTPNGDGVNETWVVYNGSCVETVQVNVYNRWGGLVYHSDAYQNDWGGTYKGSPLPDGTYYYVIVANLSSGLSSTLTGNVTIIR